MDEHKKGTRVEIFGNEYFIRGDESPEYIKQVASYVNNKIREISKNMKIISPGKVSILAALNITDEYFKIKFKKTGKKNIIKEKIENIHKIVCSELNKLN